jgi:hypothetical protein
MNRTITFLDCPAYLDGEGAARCGLPAEVRYRFIMDSTDGPVESAMIRCAAGHWFNGPIEFLTYDKAAPGPGQKIRRCEPADRGAAGEIGAGPKSDAGQGEGYLGAVSGLAGGG